MLLDYVIQNWALLLLGLAFVISLKISGFQDKSSVKRMYILIAAVFLLSIVVFEEFYLADHGGHLKTRTILMAVRYSATPLIVTMVLFTLQKKTKWFVFIPALALTAVNFISVFTGVVFNEKSNQYNSRAMAVRSNQKEQIVGYVPETILDDYRKWCGKKNCVCVGYIFHDGEALRGRVRAYAPDADRDKMMKDIADYARQACKHFGWPVPTFTAE